MQEDKNLKINVNDLFFALDIGTRNVVGIVGRKNEDNFDVIDHEIIEHPDRAMYDGQIHDINKVSEVVKKVKRRLEERLGVELKYVSIAAAGRALKTKRVKVEMNIDSTVEIEKRIINSLELEGIQKAQEEISQDEKNKSSYYCVGHTVVNYYLDNSPITNPRGHKGNKLEGDIIATFLPHIVVDSLYTVVHRANLEVISLTLEPIAAINICIPQKFRLLNLTLVDIGAGTSDIAITKDGAVVAYGMVSIAGDEITEALSKSLLLDFVTAEKLKIQLNIKHEHTFSDIVGMSYNMTTDEILDKIDDSIKNLANKISETIVEFNGKKPSAVFCIGGGSQIPRLTEYIALNLDIPKERVVIKGSEALENINFEKEKLIGPEYITPIGIGCISSNADEEDFLQIMVNKTPIRLFNSKELSISDALVLVGFNPRKLIGKKGKDLIYYFNGKKEKKLGCYGESAKIYINGELGSLDTKLKNKDVIEIEEAVNGEDAKVYIEDLIKLYNIDEYKYDILINDELVSSNYEVRENDYIELRRKNSDETEIETIEEINEKTIDLNKKEGYNSNKYITVKVNGEDIDIKKKNRDVIFVDIFDYIEFDRTKVKGTLILKLNGRKANYTDILRNNDVIEVYWE
ncbi:cell division protein FtsA [Tepidibacter formicigenes]|jgi:cell division protein FtsA|uniref:Cell division protein FtsA n=1 Tax=Tepidibacter formicigenes DSM 15518 TaxID=1123349 RepID=A0A1M6KJ37_9FIRM|nr:cell division FtsA domain-containing protein [Tepidibacter formicigenes]SHJ58945.1 cell division protein FtsA [Tepidibacter formicigenes DSM 15518]